MSRVTVHDETGFLSACDECDWHSQSIRERRSTLQGTIFDYLKHECHKTGETLALQVSSAVYSQ